MKGEKCEEEVGKGNPPSEIVTEGGGGGGTRLCTIRLYGDLLCKSRTRHMAGSQIVAR